jgi:hypothetical protein
VQEDVPEEEPEHAADKAIAYPRKNPNTNQKPALGSLSYQWDGDEVEEGYGSAEDDATAYLRAVRYVVFELASSRCSYKSLTVS